MRTALIVVALLSAAPLLAQGPPAGPPGANSERVSSSGATTESEQQPLGWRPVGSDTATVQPGDTLTLRPSNYSEKHESVWRVVVRFDLSDDSSVVATPISTYPDFDPTEEDEKQQKRHYIKTGQLHKIETLPIWLEPYAGARSVPIARNKPFQWATRPGERDATMQYRYQIRLRAYDEDSGWIFLGHSLQKGKRQPRKRPQGTGLSPDSDSGQ